MLTTFAVAQVEDGKVYRVVNSKYGTVLSESPIYNTLSCVSKGGESDYNEMWKFIATGDGKFTIQNVYTQRYVQNNSGKNVVWKTVASSGTKFTVTENKTLKKVYNIDISATNDWGMHCDASSNIVVWTYGPVDGEVSGSEWTFELVEITDEDIQAARTEYENFYTIKSNATAIAKKVQDLFEDKAGTILKADYANMSDDEVVALLEGVPADLQAAVLKIKNNAWDSVTREKEFRIYDYKPYSDPNVWAENLYVRLYSPIDNPTGICATNNRGFIYVFVDEVPDGTKIELREVAGTGYNGTDTRLKAGLNIVPTTITNGFFYIRYICETALNGKKLADYPAVKVHFENGYVNGFWSKERGHTNEDWKYMQQHMFQNEAAIQAKGVYTLLSFRKAEFIADNACPTKITELINLWDFWNGTQQKCMNIDKYYDWFNNLQLAMSDDNGFMDAGNHRTHYNNNTLNTICNYDLLMRDAGSSWGPNHEIGHNNQYTFEIVGTSEVSNNALANMVIFEQGTHTSRGNNLENQILDFENKVPYVARGEKVYGQKLFSMTRMYFQLYLYFHAAGKDPNFYPKLFERLRDDRLVGWGTRASDQLDANGYYIGSMDAKNDQLKFAEICCEIAQMDLSEFFEAWGFFIPMKNVYVGDYGFHYVYLHQEDIDASRARMQKYEKKGGHLMFLEDRLRKSKKKASPFSDGNGYRDDYSDEVPVGTANGKFGQWEDYLDENVKAQGYYYAISSGNVVIKETADAGGALGFKLYNADNGKLLTYTNKLSMKIPSSAAGANLKVVAAQADGTDYVVPHASQGPASMQKEGLKGSLQKASAILNKIANGDNADKAGYYYPEAVAALNDLTTRAKAAYSKNDTSEYSFAEWSIMVDEECNNVLNNEDARILMKEGTVFNIRSFKVGYRDQLLVGKYPNPVTTNDVNGDVKWMIEYAGMPGEYYLKSVSTERYITEITSIGVGSDSKKQEDAAKFTIAYTANGTVKFVSVDNANLAIGFDGTNISGFPLDSSDSEWEVEIVENNSAEFYRQALDELMVEADIRIMEMLNLDSLETMNIFSNNIVVIDNNLNTYALTLLDTYYEVAGNIETASVVQNQKYVTSLRQQLLNLDGKYRLVAPIVTKGEKVVWHYVISNATEKILTVSTSGKSKGNLQFTNKYTDNVLWGFAPTGRANEYKVFNAGQSGFVYQKDAATLAAPATEDYLPITIKYDAQNGGLILSAADAFLAEVSTSMTFGATPTIFRIQTALVETDKEVADVITVIEKVIPEANGNDAIYDLSGRRVEKPTRGIFIQNGKKVLVK